MPLSHLRMHCLCVVFFTLSHSLSASGITWALSGTPYSAETKYADTIPAGQWPDTFCLRLDLTYPSAVCGGELAGIGGSPGCGRIRVTYGRGGIAFNKQCDSSSNAPGFASADGVLTIGTRYVVDWCYDSSSHSGQVYVDGALSKSSTVSSTYSFPKTGVVSALTESAKRGCTGMTIYKLAIAGSRSDFDVSTTTAPSTTPAPCAVIDGSSPNSLPCVCGSKICKIKEYCASQNSTCQPSCTVQDSLCRGGLLCLAASRCVDDSHDCDIGWFDDEVNRQACSVFKMQSYCVSLLGKEEECLAGLTLIGQGFDFTKSDPLKLPESHYLHVYMLAKPESKASVLNKKFMVPVSAQVIMNLASLESSLSSEVSSSRAAQTQAYSKISGEGSYGSVSGSASARYDVSYDSKFQAGKKIAEKELVKKLFTVKLVPGIDVHPDFTYNLKQLPDTYENKNAEDKAKFTTFIEMYGTHYVSSVTFGGTVRLIVEMSSCLTGTCAEQAVAAEACAKMDKGIGSASGCAEGSYTGASCQDSTSASTSSQMRVVGGTAGSTCTSASCDTANWADTVSVSNAGSVAPIASSMRPLWEALGFDEPKRKAELRKALEHYVEDRARDEVASASKQPCTKAIEPPAPASKAVFRSNLFALATALSCSAWFR